MEFKRPKRKKFESARKKSTKFEETTTCLIAQTNNSTTKKGKKCELILPYFLIERQLVGLHNKEEVEVSKREIR